MEIGVKNKTYDRHKVSHIHIEPSEDPIQKVQIPINLNPIQNRKIKDILSYLGVQIVIEFEQKEDELLIIDSYDIWDRGCLPISFKYSKFESEIAEFLNHDHSIIEAQAKFKCSKRAINEAKKKFDKKSTNKKKLTRIKRLIKTKKFYQSKEWNKKCLYIFKRDKYVCQECKKARATEVHHIRSLAYSPPEFALMNENLVSLCHNCHQKINDENKARSKDYTKHELIKKRLSENKIQQDIETNLPSTNQDLITKENVMKRCWR